MRFHIAREVRADQARDVQPARLVVGVQLVVWRVRRLTEALGLGDEPIRHTPQLLRLRVGGHDALVIHQVAGQVAEHVSLDRDHSCYFTRGSRCMP